MATIETAAAAGPNGYDPAAVQDALKALPPAMRAAALKAGLQDFAQDFGPLDLMTADDILLADYPDPIWAVPDLMPVGLTILAGRPKVGKSWLAMQIACAVASGGMVFNNQVGQGKVLYLALEDSDRRLQQRMRQQGWQGGLPVDFMPIGAFALQLGDLRKGSIRLAKQIEDQRYRLVVIDTLSRAVGGDQNDVAEMTSALSPIQAMAHACNCALLLNDHHRKFGGADPDVIGDVLGSTGKGAVADTVWGLYKERGKSGAKLAITGRDVNEQTLALKFDRVTGCWQCQGDADTLAITERRAEILEVLGKIGRARLTNIAKTIGQDTSNTRKRLADLVNAGRVREEAEGETLFYSLP
jgi:hypothetical protein